MRSQTVVRVGITGHRPGRIVDLVGARRAVFSAIDRLCHQLPKMVLVTGGAMGFDQWVARECVNLGIPFELVLPCQPELFTSLWPIESRLQLAELCQHAADVQVVRDDLSPHELTGAVYHMRNAKIVQSSDWLVAFWNGARSGGTWHTMRRALAEDKPVFNGLKGLERISAAAFA
jgi:hypothetical protein